MLGLSAGPKSFRIGLAVLIQYRSVTASHPTSHVPVAITLDAEASSLKTKRPMTILAPLDPGETVITGTLPFLSTLIQL